MLISGADAENLPPKGLGVSMAIYRSKKWFAGGASLTAPRPEGWGFPEAF
ncbi:hypothetical protein [Salmonella bongori]|nr:hypothetical protein [Salmonella bongori]